MKRFLTFLAVLGAVVTFQNCQKAHYDGSSDTSLSEKSGALTATTNEDPEDTSTTSTVDNFATDGDFGNVCILDGPGKSVKLALSDADNLQGQNPIPQVLCMSANACINIASKIFTVKGPEFRGYCKANGNPHVTHITDAELQAKVDAQAPTP